MRRFLVLTLALPVALLATVVAGCGGASPPGHRLAIGRPEIATSSPGSVGIAKQTERQGVVHGEPELRPGEESPAVGLADKVAGCTGTELLPTPENLNDVRAATLCLLNAERAARGLAPLRLNPQLAQAALVHSRDMVARSYFAHDAPPTPASTFVDRIRAAGYLRTGAGWTIGENLAWGGGELATAGA